MGQQLQRMVISEETFAILDPAMQDRITQAVEAGAKAAEAAELTESVRAEFSPNLSSALRRALTEAVVVPAVKDAARLGTAFDRSLRKDLG